VISELVLKHFRLTPRGIIESLDLLKPIYRPTATHGHFGREPGEGGPGTFTWEKTDKAAALKAGAAAYASGKAAPASAKSPAPKGGARSSKKQLVTA
jgi:S-adenosylmethionine synthetase